MMLPPPCKDGSRHVISTCDSWSLDQKVVFWFPGWNQIRIRFHLQISRHFMQCSAGLVLLWDTEMFFQHNKCIKGIHFNAMWPIKACKSYPGWVIAFSSSYKCPWLESIRRSDSNQIYFWNLPGNFRNGVLTATTRLIHISKQPTKVYTDSLRSTFYSSAGSLQIPLA